MGFGTVLEINRKPSLSVFPSILVTEPCHQLTPMLERLTGRLKNFIMVTVYLNMNGNVM